MIGINNLVMFSMFHISNGNNEGGLFDFNATLPLMALQFLALTVLLNLIFYKPVSNVLNEREKYIRDSLTMASASLVKAEELTQQYENELSESRKKAQNIIKSAQQEAQTLVSNRLKNAQKETEVLLNNAYSQLNIQKKQALSTLEAKVDILSEEMKLKLLSYENIG
uniref:ATP synthase subunit b', chloroplastic n=1 Tax=Platysiphonia delicata TaxID=2006979 RepID=A0A1Z1M0I8_9FLOR|nr:ATP synthase CF0 subunit II [Platysiphonia delicata]ARW59579.1 ATP synthase CF0 subunit II [Platysiphonia delicata]